MEGILTPVSTIYKSPDPITDAFLTEVRATEVTAPKITRNAKKPESPDEALEVLRNEPDYESLILTLQYFTTGAPQFSITSPSPLASQLVHVLVSEILPTYWNVLHASKPGENSGKNGYSKRSTDLKLLLFCLRSVTGLNAILFCLKQLIPKSKEPKKSFSGQSIQDTLTSLLEALSAVLEGNRTVQKISYTIWNVSETTSMQRTLWIEFLGLMSGKILGIAAETEDVIGELSKDIGEKYWISDGRLYSLWLARNIGYWARSSGPNSDNVWTGCAELLSKSFRLGYTERIIKELLESLALQHGNRLQDLEKLLRHLPIFEQRNFLFSSLRLMSREYLSSVAISYDDARWWQSDASLVSATAGMIKLIVADEESRKSQLVSWLSSPSGAGIGEGAAIRRAAVAALAIDKTAVETILDKSLQQFGDQLYIRHTSVMQQEVHAQVLLLSAGYVHRKSPLRLAIIMRSGAHLSVVSNRLAASSPRARFLGMVVGEALSSLVDEQDKRMDFKSEETSTPEAKWYKSLVVVSDTVGSADALRSGSVYRLQRARIALDVESPAKHAVFRGGSRIVTIEEIEDDSEQESDTDGLIPYAKPDSDVEDSDEDATLITKNKAIAPVYIRDLISYLRDTDNYEKQRLALQTAASLIRRKATFGLEVSSHTKELATLLVGLQDRYEMDSFSEMRSQGMIAILIADPLKMGQWFSKTFFDGDYSLSQRASVLTTLGLGARELGGFISEDISTSKAASLPPSFPSKSLPDKLHKVYATSTFEASALDKLSTQLSNIMIAPMATELADKLIGPSVLKVRTFSSRMAIEKKRKKPIANTLAKVVADGFFFPLTGRFFIHLKAYGSSRRNVVFQPYLLTLFIKTLSLVIHASGPSTLSLPQMTSEFWDLLLSLRTQSIGDSTVVEALLFAFLTILEINEDKRTLVEAHGRQMLETQEWVESVFGRVDTGGSEEDEKVRMLAAGCLVRIREIVDRYQSLLMGEMSSFQS